MERNLHLWVFIKWYKHAHVISLTIYHHLTTNVVSSQVELENSCGSLFNILSCTLLLFGYLLLLTACTTILLTTLDIAIALW